MYCKCSRKMQKPEIYSSDNQKLRCMAMGHPEIYWKYSRTKLRPGFFRVQGAKVQGACDFTSILKALN